MSYEPTPEEDAAFKKRDDAQKAVERKYWIIVLIAFGIFLLWAANRPPDAPGSDRDPMDVHSWAN